MNPLDRLREEVRKGADEEIEALGRTSAEEITKQGYDVSPGNLKRLAERHLPRYRSMLTQAEAGSPYLNEQELRQLVDAWALVQRFEYSWDQLPARSRMEVIDAIEDEQ